MSDHKIVDLDEWTAARNELLVLEKELTRRSQRAGRQPAEPAVGPHRQGVPTPNGRRPPDARPALRRTIAARDLQLHVRPDYEAGCPVCSSIADSINGVLEHLKARDVTMICVSRAPIDQLVAYRQRMGWNFTWVSSFDSNFQLPFPTVAEQRNRRKLVRRRRARGSGPDCRRLRH